MRQSPSFIKAAMEMEDVTALCTVSAGSYDSKAY